MESHGASGGLAVGFEPELDSLQWVKEKAGTILALGIFVFIQLVEEQMGVVTGKKQESLIEEDDIWSFSWLYRIFFRLCSDVFADWLSSCSITTMESPHLMLAFCEVGLYSPAEQHSELIAQVVGSCRGCFFSTPPPPPQVLALLENKAKTAKTFKNINVHYFVGKGKPIR